MSPTRIARFGLGALALISLAVGLTALWFAKSQDESGPSQSDRALGLDHATVHMHLVLRQRLTSGDRVATAALLGEVAESRRVASELAGELFEARRDGARFLTDGNEYGPVLDALGAPRHDMATERATLLLAYIIAHGRHQDAASLQVATYEASRLSVDGLPESLRGLAEAARALVFSSGNQCARAQESASASRAVSGAPGAQEVFAGVDAQVVATDLEYSRRLLLDGALACCALRAGNQSEAGRLIEATALDAQGLGLAPERVLLLQTLAAAAREDADGARALAARIDPDSLTEADRARLRLLRDATSAGEHGLHDAAFRHAERDWLLAAMLEAVVDATDRDGLLERLESLAEVQAAQRLLAAEATLFDVASRTQPFFEHEHLDR